jgi:hypothetical protein
MHPSLSLVSTTLYTHESLKLFAFNKKKLNFPIRKKKSYNRNILTSAGDEPLSRTDGWTDGRRCDARFHSSAHLLIYLFMYTHSFVGKLIFSRPEMPIEKTPGMWISIKRKRPMMMIKELYQRRYVVASLAPSLYIYESTCVYIVV